MRKTWILTVLALMLMVLPSLGMAQTVSVSGQPTKWLHGNTQVSGWLLVDDDLKVATDVYIVDTLWVGAFESTGTLDVTGVATFDSTVTMAEVATVGGNLTVSGTTTLDSTVTLSQNLTVSGVAAFDSVATVGDSLSVTGNVTSTGVYRGIAFGGAACDTLVFDAATTDTLAWSGVTATDKVVVTALGDPGGYYYAEVLTDAVAIHAESSNSAEYVILLLRR
ncbi:hypothetical protein KQI63_15815 [bacterium]|nr:hypothetical protein [bacterium]